MIKFSAAFAFGATLASVLLSGPPPPHEPSNRAYKCTATHRSNLIVHLSVAEQLRGSLDRQSIAKAVEAFQACGLVAISGALSERETADFAFHAERMIEPLLKSRERVRGFAAVPFDKLADTAQNEMFLNAGEAIRERQAGRLDLLLPHTLPFNSTGVVLNNFLIPVLADIFHGKKFELKSAHTVTSLPGTASQHWHRDDAPLFHENAAFRPSTYAINAFVALDKVRPEEGPTEYLLGSHVQSHSSVKAALGGEHVAAVFEWPRGSVVLMDYRTVHRGGENSSPSTRTLAMLVYGLDWWRDAVNYMGDNYGGAQRPDPQQLGSEHGRVVSRRIAQRHPSDAGLQKSDRRLMYEHCRGLWAGEGQHAGMIAT